jgi:hypothetical protein
LMQSFIADHRLITHSYYWHREAYKFVLSRNSDTPQDLNVSTFLVKAPGLREGTGSGDQHLGQIQPLLHEIINRGSLWL